MVGLRRGATELRHEDFVEGIQQVQSKKKASLNYYAWTIILICHSNAFLMLKLIKILN